ncbi:hypothetical protein AB4Z34_22995 [Ensifer sp. 2YAB10]|uniref:hypothetical protein n=1 Tax=unclassified Ensifer TaxID=2633371 RepID=UPI003F915B73
MIDYDSIKATAKALKCRATDLIALAEGNDPFYAGLPYRKSGAEWFAGLWQQFGWGSGVHLRRLHYILISTTAPVLKPDGTAYLNTLDDWKMLTRASLAARYLGLIPASHLIDRRNPDPQVFAINSPVAGSVSPSIGVANRMPSFAYDLPDVGTDDAPDTPALYVYGVPNGQPYLVEIWCEKSTQDDILVPLCQRLGVNYVPGMGETSEMQVRQAIERCIDAGRPMRILYISDFDPAGRSMPVACARKIEFMVQDTGLNLDISLQPIALTPEQCEQFRLPRTPIKEGERRAARFEERFGEGATELDALEALHPGALARLVEEEVCHYIEPALASRCRVAGWEIDRRLRAITDDVLEPYQDEIDAIAERYAEIQDELNAAIDAAREGMERLEADAAPLWQYIGEKLEELATGIEVESPEPREAEPVEAPLFDSERSYFEQLDHYRRWQGRDE